MLLILDGAEGLLEACQAMLPAWLAAAPALQLVVTSRVPLGLREETRLSLGPLSVADGVALFFDRAQALDAGLRRTEAEQADARALVERLDGLPLAIELAAVRARLLSPGALLKRLEARPGGLRGRSPTLPARQQSLQAVLAWSWTHVSGAAQRALAQLSVLEGSFSLDLAEQVIDLSDLDAPLWAEDALSELIDAGLLQVQRAGSRRRLRLLGTVRRFVGQHLDGATRDAAEIRLADHCLSLPRSAPLAPRLLVQATEQAIRRGDQDRIWPLAERAHWLLMFRGPYEAAVKIVDVAIAALDEGNRSARARAELLQVWNMRTLGRPEAAEARAHRAIALYESLDEPEGRLKSREQLALIALDRGRFREAAAMMRALVPETAPPETMARVRVNLANILRLIGEYDEARAHLEASRAAYPDLVDLNYSAVLIEQGHLRAAKLMMEGALERATERQDHRLLIVVRQNLAEVAMLRGHLGEAGVHIAEALALQEELGFQQLRAVLMATEGVIRHAQGHLVIAAQRLRTATALFRSMRNPTSQALHLSELALVLREQGQHDDALALIREALAVQPEQPTSFTPLVAAHAVLVMCSAGDLGAARRALARAPTPAIPRNTVSLAIARAALLRHSGDDVGAQQLLQQARAQLDRTEYALSSPPGRLLTGLLQPLQTPTLPH